MIDMDIRSKYDNAIEWYVYEQLESGQISGYEITVNGYYNISLDVYYILPKPAEFIQLEYVITKNGMSFIDK